MARAPRSPRGFDVDLPPKKLSIGHPVAVQIPLPLFSSSPFFLFFSTLIFKFFRLSTRFLGNALSLSLVFINLYARISERIQGVSSGGGMNN